MEIKVTVTGILEFKAMQLSKSTFKQIENVCGNVKGEFIGYVNDELGMIYFIGTEDGKLFKTRQDYLMETLVAHKVPVTYMNLGSKVNELKGRLPQIFVK